MRRTVLAVALSLVLVLSGCAAPIGSGPSLPDDPDAVQTPGTPATGETTTPPPTADATTADATTESPGETTTEPPSTTDPESVDVPVQGGDLPVDVDRIYARVQRLTGLEAEPPTVSVQDPQDRPVTPSASPFQEAIGLAGGSTADLDCGRIGAAGASGTSVFIAPNELSPAEIELVLAHEFAHVLQVNNDLSVPTTTTDPEHVNLQHSLLEGGAVYVANEYADQYDLAWDTGDRPLELRRCFYEQSPDGLRALTGVYYFGGRYFDRTVDDPSEFAAAYETLPNTTEGLLHGHEAGTDPPVPLTVTAGVADWDVDRLGTHGELVTRFALASELNESRAAAGADGWANDTVMAFRRSGRTGFAWVHAWDDPDEAAEFVAAAGAYATERDDTAVRVVRVDAETTALLLGDEAFVEAASVRRTNGTVTVTV